MSLGEQRVEAKESMYFTIIEEAVLEGFWPFRPREIKVSSGFDISNYGDKLYIDVFFRDIVFPVSVYYEKDALAADPEEELSRIGWVLTKIYRYRPIVSSDHHLGEE